MKSGAIKLTINDATKAEDEQFKELLKKTDAVGSEYYAFTGVRFLLAIGGGVIAECAVHGVKKLKEKLTNLKAKKAAESKQAEEIKTAKELKKDGLNMAEIAETMGKKE